MARRKNALLPSLAAGLALAFSTGAAADDEAPAQEEEAAPAQAAAPAPAATTATVTVTVKGIKSRDGTVRVAIFTGSKGFPSKDDSLLVRQVSKIKDNTVKVVFEDVPYGEYALAAHHDENGNGLLDTNFVGMPKEGYGVSKDAVKGRLGPPKYDDAKIRFDKPTESLQFSIAY